MRYGRVIERRKVKMSEQSKAAKFKQLETLSKQLDEAHTITKIGREVKNSLVKLGDRPVLRVPCIKTDLPTFDYDVLQYGGIPRGRIIEIFGPESSGKTTTALYMTACEQATGGLAAYIDAEHKLEPSYAQVLGVNIDELLFNQPNSGEEALDTVDKLIETGTLGLIVVDSAAALVPEAELAGDIGDQHMGLQSRLFSQAMRILTGKAARNGVTLIFLNQIREKIGQMFGNPETTPGGRALKFYSSVRLSITRKETIWEGTKENIIGHSIDLRCVKNGGGIPFRRTQVNLIYPGKGRTPGFDKLDNIIEFASGRNVFQKQGSWFWYDIGSVEHKKVKGEVIEVPVGPEKIANGIDNLKIFLASRPDVVDRVRKDVAELIRKEETQPVAAPSV
jgi:recombination protein RecA